MIDKPIRLSGHAWDTLKNRGAKYDEVIETIQTSVWSLADKNRLHCRKNFFYGQIWNDVFYNTKQVRPIFIDKVHEIIVVTVYVYYFL